MYIEASSPRRRNDKARLVGTSQTATNGQCLEFWYHMYGRTIGSLKVYRRRSTLGTALWSKSGNHGNQWLVAHVTITSPTSGYQVVFEGVIGASYTGDIAIDDIRLLDGRCPSPGMNKLIAVFNNVQL